jgi:hypothetical protein
MMNGLSKMAKGYLPPTGSARTKGIAPKTKGIAAKKKQTLLGPTKGK